MFQTRKRDNLLLVNAIKLSVWVKDEMYLKYSLLHF